MALRREDEKHERIIRALLKLPGNRVCINCGSLGPQYVCTNFSTFICTTCSGIHREFLHRIKSVSMAKFTALEISELQSGGNEKARQIFLKGWNLDVDILPDSRNPDKIREFIRNVYVQRRFTGEKVLKESSSAGDQNAVIGKIQAAGLAYGSRGSLKTIIMKRENGNADRKILNDDTISNNEESMLNCPPNQRIASGSKRETVIRQFLQPPVEKRFVNQLQLQRNYSSGNLDSERQSRESHFQVQRSNSLSLKDLLNNEKAAAPKSQALAKSKSLVDLTEETTQPQQRRQPQKPSSRNSVATKSSSTPCLIDLLSGDASTEARNSPTPKQNITHHGSDLIDLNPEDSSSPLKHDVVKQVVDPFTITTSATIPGLDLLNARDDQIAGPVPPFDHDPGPVLPHATTGFTSLQSDFPHHPSAYGPDYGPRPESLSSYTARPGFMAPSPGIFAQPLQFGPGDGASNFSAFGPSNTTHPITNFNAGYYSQRGSTGGNPFDMAALSYNLAPAQTLPSGYYYQQHHGVYNQQSPITMQASLVFQQQQQHHPTSSSSSSSTTNPFA